MTSDRFLHAIATVTTAVLAVLLVGGSVGLALEGREVPNWLIGFDGSIVLGAFANGAFFAMARTAEPTGLALDQMGARYHELAMATATSTQPAGPHPTEP